MSQIRHALLISVALFLLGLTTAHASQHSTEEYTPLFEAADSGNTEFVAQAIQHDPDAINATSWDNETLLHEAVKHNHIELVRLLISAGANVNALTDEDTTPLDLAAQNSYLPIMYTLLINGARTDIKDKQGRTAADRATQWGQLEASSILKMRGSSPN